MAALARQLGRSAPYQGALRIGRPTIGGQQGSVPVMRQSAPPPAPVLRGTPNAQAARTPPPLPGPPPGPPAAPQALPSTPASQRQERQFHLANALQALLKGDRVVALGALASALHTESPHR